MKVKVEVVKDVEEPTITKSTSYWMCFYFGMWDLKGRHQSADWCKKVSGGHFFSPWESPFIFGRSP